MRAIAVGDEIGIGTAATVGKRDRVATNADSNFKKRVDMFVRVGRSGWYHRVVVFVVVVWDNQRVVNPSVFNHLERTRGSDSGHERTRSIFRHPSPAAKGARQKASVLKPCEIGHAYGREQGQSC